MNCFAFCVKSYFRLKECLQWTNVVMSIHFVKLFSCEKKLEKSWSGIMVSHFSSLLPIGWQILLSPWFLVYNHPLFPHRHAGLGSTFIGSSLKTYYSLTSPTLFVSKIAHIFTRFFGPVIRGSHTLCLRLQNNNTGHGKKRKLNLTSFR